MRKMDIYLAGAMLHCESFNEMNEWRVSLGSKLRDACEDCNKYMASNIELRVINPCLYYNFQEPYHQNELEVMNFDLSRVKHSDIVIANLSGINTSIGTSIELYEAYKDEIPVIAYDPDSDYDDIHKWIQCCITRVETSEEELVRYIESFYFL